MLAASPFILEHKENYDKLRNQLKGLEKAMLFGGDDPTGSGDEVEKEKAQEEHDNEISNARELKAEFEKWADKQDAICTANLTNKKVIDPVLLMNIIKKLAKDDNALISKLFSAIELEVDKAIKAGPVTIGQICQIISPILIQAKNVPLKVFRADYRKNRKDLKKNANQSFFAELNKFNLEACFALENEAIKNAFDKWIADTAKAVANLNTKVDAVNADMLVSNTKTSKGLNVNTSIRGTQSHEILAQTIGIKAKALIVNIKLHYKQYPKLVSTLINGISENITISQAIEILIDNLGVYSELIGNETEIRLIGESASSITALAEIIDDSLFSLEDSKRDISGITINNDMSEENNTHNFSNYNTNNNRYNPTINMPNPSNPEDKKNSGDTTYNLDGTLNTGDNITNYNLHLEQKSEYIDNQIIKIKQKLKQEVKVDLYDVSFLLPSNYCSISVKLIIDKDGNIYDGRAIAFGLNGFDFTCTINPTNNNNFNMIVQATLTYKERYEATGPSEKSKHEFGIDFAIGAVIPLWKFVKIAANFSTGYNYTNEKDSGQERIETERTVKHQMLFNLKGNISVSNCNAKELSVELMNIEHPFGNSLSPFTIRL